MGRIGRTSLKGIMTTVNAYRASQPTVDRPSKKNFRMDCAGAANTISTTTRAEIATTKTQPEYDGRFSGVAIRVPIPVGSLSDMTFVMSDTVTVEQIDALIAEGLKVIVATGERVLSSYGLKDFLKL